MLSIPPHKPTTNIKPHPRSFYTLSKTHHPDHNPKDPHAPRRFMLINEAYSTLRHPEKRARYDRDVMRLRHHQATHHPPKGSYHSTGPAGGRPASGLSRRRGSFTGPPPSFFRNGAWGAQGSKRKAAHEESAGGGAEREAGMGPGQDPYHGTRTRDAPHWDRQQHERTQRNQAERRARRMAGLDEGSPFVDTGLFGRFLVVGGVILFAGFVPIWLSWGDGAVVRRKVG